MTDEQKLVPLSLDTVSVVRGQPLIVRTTDSNISKFRQAQFSIARVDADEDLWVLAGGSAVKVDDGIGSMTCSTQDLLEGRLYRLLRVILMPSDAADPREPGSQQIVFDDGLFEVIAPGQAIRTQEALKAQYDEVMAARKAEFISGIGNPTPNTLELQGFVFIKNCLIQTPMRLGRYRLFPFNGLGCSDEIALVNAVLAQTNNDALKNIDDVAKRAQAGQPCVVLYFPRVFAASVEEAGDLIKKEGALLCDVLALHRNSYGSVFAGLLLRPGANLRYFWIDTPHYTGNLLGGFLAGEVPSAIRAHVDKARSSPRLALYLSLLGEALREQRTEFAYFRHWNLLETIARGKGFIGQPLLDWGGAQKQSSKGKPLFIQDQAEQLVFELFRSKLAGQFAPSALSGGQLQQGTFEELIPIWYRHRNCVVHGGGCFPHDTSFCLRNEAKYINCKRAHDEVEARDGPRERFNDEYLNALQHAASLILEIEFG
jgi:hypothetical protein